ncbi:MAG: hypothetical protein AB7F19_00310 [Candidatus Babeliales bacterium]
MFYAFLLLSLASCHHAHAMLVNSLPSAPAMNGTCSAFEAPASFVLLAHGIPLNAGSGDLAETDCDITSLPPALRKVVLQDNVLKAVDRGDADQVESHFSQLRHWVQPWDYYRQGVAIALYHAAKLPQEQTGAVVECLLKRVSATEIEQPALLLKAATENRHFALIQYVETTFRGNHTVQPVCKARAANESLLHQAARAGDYEACLAHITHWSGPINKDQIVPVAAAKIIETARDEKSPAVKQARIKLARFVVTLGKHINTRFAVARSIRLAKNAQGQTAQQVAKAAGASNELIALLDPQNKEVIRTAIMIDIDKRIEGYVEQPFDKPVETKSAESTLNGDCDKPGFKQGDVIEVNGKTYVVTKHEKVI